MIGITSYGAYIPRLRMNRMAMFAQMSWFAPAVIMIAQGERSMCNYDEDSITMAVAAALDCVTGKDKSKIDAGYLCSTTMPFDDRQNAGIMAAALNLRDNINTADFTSSQRAGTTGLLTALNVVQSGERKNILVTATDSRQAKASFFYDMWFGDGAASLLVGNGDDVIAEFKGSYSVTYDFVDHYRAAKEEFGYMWEERWMRDEGYAKIIPEAVNGLMKKLNITMNDVNKVVFPCFFKAEHRNIAKKLGATPDKVIDNMHDVCGETGVAHPLLMFVAALEQSNPGDGILVAGFGQGSDALYFKVTENIKKLPKRVGVKGSLENKKTTDQYTKFLVLKDLMKYDMGMRAESATKTGLTTLWRQRKAIMGMVGGKCRNCGTPQFPKKPICVNPACGAVNSQDDYEFATVPARIRSHIGDLLAVCLDPPVKYGMVQFEGGGRYLMNYTDCDAEELKVGLPVKMSFRKKYKDNIKGFTGYFWKAVLVPGGVPDLKF